MKDVFCYYFTQISIDIFILLAYLRYWVGYMFVHICFHGKVPSLVNSFLCGLPFG